IGARTEDRAVGIRGGDAPIAATAALSAFQVSPGNGVCADVSAAVAGCGPGPSAGVSPAIDRPDRTRSAVRAFDDRAARVPALAAVPCAAGNGRAPRHAIFDLLHAERERLLPVLYAADETHEWVASDGDSRPGRAADSGRSARRRIGSAGGEGGYRRGCDGGCVAGTGRGPAICPHRDARGLPTGQPDVSVDPSGGCRA